MMTGMLDEVTDEVPFYLYQSEDTKEIVQAIYSMKQVTYQTLLKEKRFKSDFLSDCYTTQVTRDELPYYIERLKLAHAKKLANDYMRDINKLMHSPCTLEEFARLLRDGVNIDFVQTDSKLVLMPKEYAKEHFNDIMERATNPEVKKGIHFRNFPELNSTFYGLQGGDLLLVCAQSGHGKTAFALNIVNDIAIDQDYTVYYANAEMKEDELTKRIASNRAVIPTQEVMSATFQEVNRTDALAKLSDQYDLMANKKLILSRIPVMSTSSIRRAFKKLANSGNKPDFILIDYIGRMDLERKESGLTEWQKLYLLSEDIKTLAIELDVPIVALAQLNEDGKIEGAKKMKNACDGVLFFEPITDDEPGMTQVQKQYANYKIVKYKVRRNDNSRPIYINFTKKYQRIAEVF